MMNPIGRPCWWIATLIAVITACKTPRESTVRTFDYRNGSEWVVIGAVDPNGTVQMRFCTRDDIAALAESGTDDTRLLLARCKGNEGFPDIPVKAYEMLFGAQFGIEDMSGDQSKINVAMVLEQTYSRNRQAAEENGDNAAVKDWDEQIAKKKTTIAELTAKIKANQNKLDYVASVMASVLPVTIEDPAKQQVAAGGSGNGFEESHRLISDDTPGFIPGSKLIDELKTPFKMYYGVELDPEVMQRVNTYTQSSNPNDPVAKVLQELGGIGKLKGVIEGLAVNAEGPGGQSYEAMSYWAAQRHCRQKQLALPSVKSVGALYAHSRIMTGADPVAKGDFVWVSDGTRATSEAPRLLGEVSQAHSVDRWLADIRSQLKFDGSFSLGSVMAFAPSNGKSQTFALELSNANEATARTVCVREPEPVWLDDAQVIVCIGATKSTRNRTIIGVGAIFAGVGEAAVKAAATEKCEQYQRYNNARCNVVCKNALSN